MAKSIADFGLRVGQRYQEMRKAARQWEVESFYTDSRAVSHVCLRDILDPSRRVTLVPSALRSEEHTSELQSLMRISYAVFCLKKKKENDKDGDNHYKIRITYTTNN